MTTDLVKKEETAVNMFIEEFSPNWGKILGGGKNKERFERVALACILKSPKIGEVLKTDIGKVSLANAFLTCAQLNIEPDGRLAHIIPYGSTVQFQIDYKGIVELVHRSGLVSKIHADRVCENDIFEYDKGEITKHRIDWKKSRGNAYAYYVEITFKDGTIANRVMQKEDIDAIRRRSKTSDNGPWKTDYDEMAKKTVFKNLSKWVSLTPELKDAVEKDNEGDSMIDVTPVKSPLENGGLFQDKTKVKKADAIDISAEKPIEKSPEELLIELKTMFTDDVPVSFDEVISWLMFTKQIANTDLTKNITMMRRLIKNLESVVNKTLSWKETKEVDNVAP